MTDEFRQMTERLAKGFNFPKGTVVLITNAEDESQVEVITKGCVGVIVEGICEAIRMELEHLDDERARLCRERIEQELIADEERRFQMKEGDA